MIIVTTLVIPVGGDAGPFDLYTDSDGFAVPFATNVSAAALEAGYTSTVPNDATIVRVVSVGLCTNFIDLDIALIPPTTTTTSSSSTSTSTTTSTSSSTTTTTTTFIIPLLCYQAEVYPPIFNPGTYHTVQYLDCNNVVQTLNVPDGGTMVTICYKGIVSDNGNGITNPLFTYCFAPTTTSTTTSSPAIPCNQYTVSTTAATGQTYTYTDCYGVPQSGTVGGVSGYDAQTFCAEENSIVGTGETTTTYNEPCTA